MTRNLPGKLCQGRELSTVIDVQRNGSVDRTLRAKHSRMIRHCAKLGILELGEAEVCGSLEPWNWIPG